MGEPDIGVEELEALRTAADAVATSVQRWDDLDGIDVVDVMPKEAALGHPALAAACQRFSTRWEQGINAMVADAAEVSSRLSLSARHYEGSDRSVQDLISNILEQDSQRLQGVWGKVFGTGP